MKTQNRSSISNVDSHTAIARAHADRARHMRTAVIRLAGLLKRHIATSRPTRQRQPRFGAWA